MELLLLYKKIRFKILFELAFIIQIIKCIEPLCNKTHPILKNGSCNSIYCSQEQFISSECLINNPIIKTQWLTRLIPISDLNFRFINPVLSKKNDLIIQTTKSTGSRERKFFGITKDGRYFFKNSNGDEYPYFSINATDEENAELYMFQNVGKMIQIVNNDTEYFLNIGGYNNSYSEIIDFEKGTISRVSTVAFYSINLYSEIGSIVEMTSMSSDTDKNHYYIFSFVTELDGKFYFIVKIYYFNSTDIKTGYKRTTNIRYQICSNNKKSSSCFEAHPSHYIFCFFQDSNYGFTINVYDSTLSINRKLEKEIDNEPYAIGNENIFLKALHLTQNVGFFIYYKSISYTYPFIQIKEYDGNDELNDFNSYGLIKLNKYIFNQNLHLNDAVKVKEDQIYFSSCSPEKTILYIVLFNFYNEFSKLVIRYYSIKLYELYNKKILFEIKLIQFTKFLSLSSSLCSSSQCENNDDEHYSYLMIFSYPNSTDVNFNLIEHLLETNETISSININLFDYVKIENNFFGYVLKRIKILSIPEKITITSCLNGNEINSNSFLTENENISISVSLENQTINEKYIIEYALTLSNPDYINLNDYIIDIDKTYGDSKEGNFYNIEEYIGRTSFFKIVKNIINLEIFP